MKKLLFLSLVLTLSAEVINATEKDPLEELRKLEQELEQFGTQISDLKQSLGKLRKALDVDGVINTGLILATQGVLWYAGKMMWELSSIGVELGSIKACLTPLKPVARAVALKPFTLPIALSQATTAVNSYGYANNTKSQLKNAYEKHGKFAANNIRQGLINALDGSVW